jgi:hypothetical protein
MRPFRICGADYPIRREIINPDRCDYVVAMTDAVGQFRVG